MYEDLSEDVIKWFEDSGYDIKTNKIYCVIS
jgi:hypothetical protein